MLGQLYKPKGKALDTARAVLECDDVYACNVAKGCTNQCSYCWLKEFPYFMKNGKMEFPKKPPVNLVREQSEKGLRPEGIFLSFLTDPFLYDNRNKTDDLINYLIFDCNVRIATLSKINHSCWFGTKLIRTGMTIVSLDRKFVEKYEPEIVLVNRIGDLEYVKRNGGYVWVSIEPYPTPDIWKQDLIELLKELSFVDFLLFGKWNYDWRAENFAARIFYRDMVDQFVGFCREHKIRHYVKPDTLKFIGR